MIILQLIPWALCVLYMQRSHWIPSSCLLAHGALYALTAKPLILRKSHRCYESANQCHYGGRQEWEPARCFLGPVVNAMLQCRKLKGKHVDIYHRHNTVSWKCSFYATKRKLWTQFNVHNWPTADWVWARTPWLFLILVLFVEWPLNLSLLSQTTTFSWP